jgi:uncharacterized membrane protein YkvA (DUF1232 family)
MKKLTKKEIEEQLRNRTDFFDILVENTKNYNGKFKKIMNNAPDIFILLCNLLHSKNIEKEYRIKISAVIAYFILPRDVYPEKIIGLRGYFDDILLCLYLLRELRDHYEIEELLQYWEGDSKLLEYLLTEGYEKFYKEYKIFLNDMLEYIGIK